MFASCGGETTAPREPATVTTLVHVTANFPELSQNAAFAVLVPFTRVRATLSHADGSVAVDTTMNLVSTARVLSFEFSVKQSASTPPAGERMSLQLSYVDANGTTVFRAGPAPIMVGPAISSSFSIDALYVGPGASAKTVRISPRTLSVNAGDNFSFSAAALDASNATIPNAPIEWVSLDTARAAMNSNTLGAGEARIHRGPTRIVARLITGQADTVVLDVQPVATAIAMIAGNGQIGAIGNVTATTLAQPLVVKVIASDSLALAGVIVTFSTLNGGSFSPSTAVTDSNGVAQTSWTLANSAGLQTATATASGLAGSPVTFSATGKASVASTGSLYWLQTPASGYPTEVTLTSMTLLAYDQNGPLSGVPVRFVVTGGGSVNHPTLTSGLDGHVTVDWTLGAPPGLNTLTANSPGLDSASISTRGFFPGISVVFTVPTLGARQHTGFGEAQLSFGAIRDFNLYIQLTHTRPASVGLPPSPVRLVTFFEQDVTVEGLAPGVDTITPSAPKYLSTPGVLQVTLPVLSASALPATVTTLTAPVDVTVSARDAAGALHLASDTVVIHAVSSDATVIQPSQSYFHILKNASVVRTAVNVIAAGKAHITYSDSGGHSISYVTATTSDIIVNPPALVLDGYLWEIGMRQNSANATEVAIPTVLGQPLTVSLTSADTTLATVPATVTIPAGKSSVTFVVTGHDVIGTTQITAIAPGFGVASHAVQVTRPQFRIFAPIFVYTTSPTTFYVVAQDAYGNIPSVNQAVVVTLASLNPSILGLDSTTVTIPAGGSFSNLATVFAVGPGTGRITASDARIAPYAYQPYTATINAVTPTASLNFLNLDLGFGQYFPSDVPLVTPAYTSMTVPITHTRSGVTSTPSSVLIAQGRFFAPFNVVAIAAGTDTITISPPGYVPASGEVVVAPGRLGTFFSWPASLRVGDSVRVSLGTFGPLGRSARSVIASTVINLSPNANIQIVSGSPNSAPLTSVTIPADGFNVDVYVKGVAPGTGSLSLNALTYTPFTTTTTVTP